MKVVDLGLISYQEGLKQQSHYFSKKLKGDSENYLLLLEHTPVFTFGKRDSSEDMLVKKEWLTAQGFDVVKTDRGGRVTYHAPGQVVGYVIHKLSTSIPTFVSRVEEGVIQTLKEYGISGKRDPEYPGVWVGHNKIAALGFRIEKGISRHGFSLNVNCDLSPYAYVNPCGILNRGVTSFQKELGKKAPEIKEVKKVLIQKFTDFR